MGGPVIIIYLEEGRIFQILLETRCNIWLTSDCGRVLVPNLSGSQCTQNESCCLLSGSVMQYKRGDRYLQMSEISFRGNNGRNLTYDTSF